jgi:long-chain acyl-CoA synthetase
MLSRDTVVDRFLDHVESRPGDPALWHHETEGDRDEWVSRNWGEYGRQAKAFAGALVGMGLEDNQRISISAYNCPQWLIANVGAMMARLVPVGIYHTNSPKELAYVARHSESKVIVAENKEHWAKIDEKRDELPDLERIVVIRGIDDIDDPMAVGFEAFLEEGEAHLDEVDARVAAISRDDVAEMIYTSGTTGDPKGVMLTHDNLAFTADQAKMIVGDLAEDDSVVSYLPLSHIAEQMFSIHLAITFGYEVWFADDVYEVKEALVAARPSLFFGVPRIWEKFRSALENKLDEATGLKAAIVKWARQVGTEAGYHRIEEGEVGGWLGMKYAIADRLFFSKLKAQLGLDQLKIALSAAAPIGVDVLEFFLSCDITIHEIYGQSEDTGPTSFNVPEPGKTKLGSVGLPLPDIDVRIGEGDLLEDQPGGEILVRGDNVFKGYFKDQEATDEALKDGWLHSGDLGYFDEDGFLYITGRKKEIIITSGGKNIAPAKIENALRDIDGISQAMAIGDRRSYVTALLTLDPDRYPGLAEERGWPADAEELVASEGFRAYVDEEIERVNDDLARVETIKEYTVLPKDFTQETGELTPTQKIKRRVVQDKYATEIEAMYQ